MSRKRYVYDPATDSHVEITQDPERRSTSWQVMPDIQPYKSMVDGSLITSRSVHREHLKAHGCVEVGNDSSLFNEPRPLKSPPGLKEVIIEAAHRHLRYEP